MSKTRLHIPKVTRDGVLAEFNHRCAICGADKPQVHHIDENPSNNDPTNLIPLCRLCPKSDVGADFLYKCDSCTKSQSVSISSCVFGRANEERGKDCGELPRAGRAVS